MTGRQAEKGRPRSTADIARFLPSSASLATSNRSAPGSLRGTLTDPLRADGLSGDVRGDIEKLDTLLAIAGAATRLDIPLTLASPIITLQLSQLDIDKFLKGTSSVAGKASGAAAVHLEVDPSPAALVEAQLGSKQFVWGGVQLGDLDLHLSITPGKMAVSDASLSLAGGGITGSAEAVPAGEGVAITLHTAVAGLDVGPLLRMIGSASRGISGRVDGRINLALTSNTLGDALGAAHGQLALAITKGQVARQVLQMASTDLGLLFHKESGMIPILCLLAVANVHDGIVALSPLRLRTHDGTIVGGGSINLRHQTLDITFETVSETTGFFSLDIPIHVTGSLADPGVHPGSKNEMHALAAQAARNLRQLSPDLAPVATANPCVR